jgi:hypothetical protein
MSASAGARRARWGAGLWRSKLAAAVKTAAVVKTGRRGGAGAGRRL